MAHAGPERPARRVGAAVAGAFLLLGVAFTWPLVRHLHDALPYAAVPPAGRELAWRVQGDYLQLYYYLWLAGDRTLDGASPLRDPYQFAVDGPRWNLPNLFLPFALVYVPLSLAGPRLAYNLLVLLSFPAAGLTVWLLARRYGLQAGPALVASAVFALAPYRVGALLGGHPAGFAYFLLPLALWGLEGALAGSLAGAGWAAAALVSIAIVEPHFFYFAGLGLPVYLAARLALPAWRAEALRPGALAWAGALAIAVGPARGALAALRSQGWAAPGAVQAAIGGLVALVALGLWQLGTAGLLAAGVTRDARAAARRSLVACLPWIVAVAAGGRAPAPLVTAAVALPALLHLLWVAPACLGRGRPAAARALAPLALVAAGAGAGTAFLLLLRQLLLTRSVSGAGRTLHEVLLFSPLPADLLARVNPSAGRAIYPGLLALALAAVAGLAWTRRPPPPDRRILLVFVPLLGLALALSLGPRLTALPLFEVAFRLVPGWNFIRQPAKLQVLVSLALALLAAAGAQALAGAGRTGLRAALPVALALGIAGEFHPGIPAGLGHVPTTGAAYETIRDLGPRALYLPLWPGDSSYSALYLYATTLTRVPLLNGYSAWLDRSYLTDVYRALEPANFGVVGPAEQAALRRYRVRQVVLDAEAFPLKVSPFGPAFTLAMLRTSPYLELVRLPDEGEALWVFRVLDAPAARETPAPTSPLGIYWEAESLVRDTGRVADDPRASNGRVVLAEAPQDRPGFVTFGPYRLLPPGRYRATFRLRGQASEATIQVTTDGGRRVLGERLARPAGGPGFEEVVVPFAVDGLGPVEYRTRWDGRGTLAVDAIAVAFADVPDPPLTLEVEALPHELVDRADPAASGGRAGYARPGRAPRDQVWHGPLRRYPAGRHRLLVRLRLDGATAAPLAWCGARAASDGPTLGGRELAGAEVGEAGRYVELAVPFVLSEPTVLEFPCVYRGTAGVWFDRLTIEPATP